MITAFFRTLILYFILMTGLRLMGKRQIGELEPSELVLTLIISDLAAVPMQDFGIPLVNGVFPIVTLLCVIGAYACNNRLFDVGLMFFFGVLGFLMRCRGYSVAPMTLAIVLGNMMDSNFRRAISLAVSSDNILFALFGRPITMVLLVLTVFSIVTNIPAVKRARDRRKAARQK